MRPTGLVAAIALGTLGGCFTEPPVTGETADTTSTTSSCERGSVGCPCFPNGTCDAGLTCDAGICAPLEATSADGSTSTTRGSTGSTGSADSTGADPSTTSADGSSSDESSTGTAPAHILFTTSTSYTGLEVGSLANADEVCTTLGQQLRSGPWVAVLRDAVTSLESRITIEGDVVNAVGELLANDEAELLSGTVQSIPGHDEAGVPVPNQDLVWTGSTTDDCVGWSSDDVMALGAVGLPTDPERWLDSEIPLPCSAAPRLYCVSQ